ncbi:hypothetical protein KQI84_08360 [bacterium]|nr:hypothetical protein [bacterium]
MRSLNGRENVLVEVLSAALPGHRVAGKLGTESEARASGITRAPEIQVGFARWVPARNGIGQSGGFDIWTIRIIEEELRAPENRRVALYDTVAAVREALAGCILADGHSPLVPTGGRLLQAREPYAVWEETFEESVPLSNETAPVFFEALDTLGLGFETTIAGSPTVALPASADVSLGDLLYLRVVATGAIHCFGTIRELEENTATIDFPVGKTIYPAEAEFFTPTGAIAAPVCPAPGSQRTLTVHANMARTLEGCLCCAMISPCSESIDLCFAPILQSDADSLLAALVSLSESETPACYDGQGISWRIAIQKAPQVEMLSAGMARLVVGLELQELVSFDGMVAES